MRLSELLGDDGWMPEAFAGRLSTSVINELFDQPAPFQMHQIDDNMIVAGFNVGPLKYISYFSRGHKAGQEFWDFTFEFAENDDDREAKGETGVDNTGLGGEFVVFATVMKIMKEFVNKFKPAVLKFSGAKADAMAGVDKGRSKLYKVLVGKLGNLIARMGYTVDHKDVAGATHFTMVRKDAVKENGGRIVKGVNTTCDVGTDEIQRQAAKFGNKVSRDGVPARKLGTR
jgi:hypothetical protein